MFPKTKVVCACNPSTRRLTEAGAAAQLVHSSSACAEPWVWSPAYARHMLDILTLRSWELEGQKNTAILSYQWFEARLRYMKLCAK